MSLTLVVDCRGQKATVTNGNQKEPNRTENPSGSLIWVTEALLLQSAGQAPLQVVAVLQGRHQLATSVGSTLGVSVVGNDGTESGVQRESRRSVVHNGSSSRAAARILHDADGKWDNVLGLGRTQSHEDRIVAILIRPDGHVAAKWRAGGSHLAEYEVRQAILLACEGVLGRAHLGA